MIQREAEKRWKKRNAELARQAEKMAAEKVLVDRSNIIVVANINNHDHFTVFIRIDSEEKEKDSRKRSRFFYQRMNTQLA